MRKDENMDKGLELITNEIECVLKWKDNSVVKDILDCLDVGIQIVNKDGVTIFYNKTCEKIDGISANDVIGKHITNFVEKDIIKKPIAIDILKKGVRIEETQTVNDKHIYILGVPIFRNNEIVFVVICNSDISKLETTQLQLQKIKELSESIKNELSILHKLNSEESNIVFYSEKMLEVKELAIRIAKSDATVFISGETGVGKGLIADYIHENSYRRNMPFIKVDCSVLPANLIESELFGYEGGAYTGANKTGKIGLIQASEGGTLFIDEIGELPPNIQVKLLQFLQDKTIKKIGSEVSIRIDTRIITATNKDLELLVYKDEFRKDLYYRLMVIPIHVPALRYRKADIIPLIDYFLEKVNYRYNHKKKLSSKCYKILYDYDWPGNVRELENIIERLVIVSSKNIIDEDDVLECDFNFRNEPNYVKNKDIKQLMKEYESSVLKEYIASSCSMQELVLKTGYEESTIRKKCKLYNLKYDFPRKKTNRDYYPK